MIACVAGPQVSSKSTKVPSLSSRTPTTDMAAFHTLEFALRADSLCDAAPQGGGLQSAAIHPLNRP
jgi:hypothetical protein